MNVIIANEQQNQLANLDVDIIKSISLPTGILNNVDLIVYDRDLEDNEIAKQLNQY